jgi:hypothetical protein
MTVTSRTYPVCNALAGLVDPGGIPTQGGATRLRRFALPRAVMWLAHRAEDPVSETMKNKRWTILHVSHTSALKGLCGHGLALLTSTPAARTPENLAAGYCAVILNTTSPTVTPRNVPIT